MIEIVAGWLGLVLKLIERGRVVVQLTCNNHNHTVEKRAKDVGRCHVSCWETIKSEPGALAVVSENWCCLKWAVSLYERTSEISVM